MKVSVLIPAYNEERTIANVIKRVQAVDLGTIETEIVVIDDGSRDGTHDALKGISDILHVSRERNGGKGAALTTGLRMATGDIIILQDADLEYDPQDYRAVIQPILDGRSEVVMGSRFLFQRPVFFGKRRSPYFFHYLGNIIIVFITNLLYGHKFTDYEGCYKAFTRQALASTPVLARGFAFDNELICKLMRKGVRIVEVPIRYTPRSYAHGKKVTWRHGLIMLWTIIKWRFVSF